MRNIPKIFKWNRETHTVIDEQNKFASWVFEGKGIPTRKYDGVAIKVEKGKVWRRVEWHIGETMPVGFVRSQDPDPKRPNASLPGWVPVPESFLMVPKGPDERALKEAWDWLRQDLAKIAFNNMKNMKAPTVVNPYAPTPPKPALPQVSDGTYELCGPKIHRNPEGFKTHVLLLHGADVVKHVPRKYESLKKFLETYEGEGIVWHYRTGSTTLMAKIKREDFGFRTRISKEDVAMAYRQEPAPEKIFEKDNPETGDDIHLEPVVVGTGDTSKDSHKVACETTLF